MRACRRNFDGGRARVAELMRPARARKKTAVNIITATAREICRRGNDADQGNESVIIGAPVIMLRLAEIFYRNGENSASVCCAEYHHAAKCGVRPHCWAESRPAGSSAKRRAKSAKKRSSVIFVIFFGLKRAGMNGVLWPRKYGLLR